MPILSIFLFFTTFAYADMGEIFSDLAGRPEQKSFTKFSYQLRQYESSGIKGSGQKLRLRQHEVETAIPLSNQPENKWKLNLNSFTEELGSSARFSTGRPLPNTLWNPSLSVTNKRTFDEGKTLSSSFGFGSPSDRPFGAFRDLSFQANLVYKLPKTSEASWLFFLSFANNRSFLNYVPLPGFAYFFRPHERLRLLLGLPFLSLIWTPAEKTILTLTYFPTNNAQARISHFLFGPAHIYLQAKYHSKNYFLSDRGSTKERLYYEEAVVNTGITAPLERYALADLSIGYSFDRKYFLGEKSSARKTGPRLFPEKAPYASAKLIFTF